MRRIGIYTGKIYSEEDFHNNNINECAMCIDPALDNDASIEEVKTRQRIRKLMNCSDCRHECIESRRK